MKLDVIQGQKGLLPGPRTKFVRELARICLFVPRFVNDQDCFFAGVSIDMAEQTMKIFNHPFAAYFLFNADPFTQTISLCPPIPSDDMTHVSFDTNDYEVAWRDGCWPIEIVDLQVVVGLTVICPYPRGRSLVVDADGNTSNADVGG